MATRLLPGALVLICLIGCLKGSFISVVRHGGPTNPKKASQADPRQPPQAAPELKPVTAVSRRMLAEALPRNQPPIALPGSDPSGGLQTKVPGGTATATLDSNGNPIGIAFVIDSTGVAVSQGDNSQATIHNSSQSSVAIGSPINVNSQPNGKHPLVDVAFVVNSSAVAISQGSGAAVAVSNSSHSGVGVGGSANVNSGPTQTLNPNGIGNIAFVADSFGVAISQGSGAAVAVLNSPQAGVGVGGSTNINNPQSSSSVNVNHQSGVAVANGSGAAVVVLNSPHAGVGVGGSVNIGNNKPKPYKNNGGSNKPPQSKSGSSGASNKK